MPFVDTKLKGSISLWIALTVFVENRYAAKDGGKATPAESDRDK